MSDLLELPVHCVHCRGHVLLTAEPSKKEAAPAEQRWTCPLCRVSNRLTLKATLVGSPQPRDAQPVR